MDKNLQFKMSTEENNTNYLDISIHRNNNNIDLNIYRKPTSTNTTIQFSSNYLYEHKIAAFRYYIHRMVTLPITEKKVRALVGVPIIGWCADHWLVYRSLFGVPNIGWCAYHCLVCR